MFNFQKIQEPKLTLPQFRMVMDHFLAMNATEFAAAFGIKTVERVKALRAGTRPVSGVLVTAMWHRLYDGVPAWAPDYVANNQE